MSTATVLYVLNQGGNLNTQLPQTTAKLEALRSKAVQTQAATKGLGTSLPLPSFEKFTAVVGAAVIGTAALMSHAVGLEKELRALGVDTGKAAAALGGYEQATDRLSQALEQLELTAATAMSGDLGRLVDMLTGAALVAERLIDKFGGLATGIRNIGLAAVDMMADMGPALGPLSALASIFSSGANLAGMLATAGSGAPTRYDGPIYGPDLPSGFSPDGLGGAPPTRSTSSKTTAYQDLVKPISGVSGLPGLFDPATMRVFDDLTDSLRQTVTAMDPLPGALDMLSSAVDEGFRRLATNEMAGKANDLASAFGSGDLGNLAGTVAGMAAGGPIGALVGTLISIGPNLDDLNKTLTKQLMSFIPETVDALVNMMSVNGRNMARQIPELAEQIGEAIPELILALAANLPGIIVSALSLLVTVPSALVKGIAQGIMDAAPMFPGMFVDSFLRAWRAIKHEIREIFGLGEGNQARDFFNADANRFAGNGNFGNPNYNPLARGRGSSSRGVTYNFNGPIQAPDVRRFNEELRRAQGTHGYGLTLDPLVR